MPRKLIVAAVAAAGIVGLGSAATAADLGLSTDQVKNAVTGNTNLDNFVGNSTNGQDLTLPPGKGDVVDMLEELRGNASQGSLLVQEGRVAQGTDGLTNSVNGLARSIETQNAELPGGKAKTADRLVASLNRAAAGLDQVPDERVHDAVTVNDELSRGLLGLEKSLQRMQELDQQDVLDTGNGDVLDNKLTETRLSDLTDKVRAVSVR